MVSGKHWLNFIKPDTPVLTHCETKTVGRGRKLNRMDIAHGVKANGKLFCQVQYYLVVDRKPDRLVETHIVSLFLVHQEKTYYVKEKINCS